MSNSPNISSEWKVVLDNYLKLSESWKQEIFLKSMSLKQKEYLIQITQQVVDENNSTEINVLEANKIKDGLDTSHITMYGTNSDIDKGANHNFVNNSGTNLQIDANSIHKNSYHNSSNYSSGKDNHLLSHKDYKLSKRKWWAALLPIFIIAMVVSSLSGLVFFAWIGGGLPRLSVLTNLPGNKAKADESSYPEWIKQFDTIVNSSETSDSDGDGIRNIEEFTLGLNPTLPDENNNGILDGLDYINKDISLIKNVGEASVLWQSIDKQQVFLGIQKSTLNSLGLPSSEFSLLKLSKIVIPKLNNLEVIALPEKTNLVESSSTLKNQAAIVHYLGTDWAGENLSVWFSNEGQIEQMLPGDTMEAYLQDDQNNNWYQLYQLKAANTFAADSREIFDNETKIPNLKIVLCQPKNGCNMALVLTFEIKETRQISFDNDFNSGNI